MQENEQVQSDVEQVSSEPIEPASNPASDSPKEASAAAEPKPNTTPEENLPFHKDPKVQEYLERQISKRAETYEKKLAEQERQFKDFQKQYQDAQSKAPNKREVMLERLKGIDPEFADLIANTPTKAELEELRSWKAQQEAQTIRQQALSQIEKLHAEHKVDPQLRDRYMRDIEYAVQRNPNAQLEDLPKIYKQVHDSYSSWIEQIKRAEREAYVKAKKESSTAPSTQTRGTPVRAKGKDDEWASNRDDARAQLIQRVVKQAKANNDL